MEGIGGFWRELRTEEKVELVQKKNKKKENLKK